MSQQFTADSTDVKWEDETGDFLEPIEEAYHPFNMVQPQENDDKEEENEFLNSYYCSEWGL